jgi:hypothetical protein
MFQTTQTRKADPQGYRTATRPTGWEPQACLRSNDCGKVGVPLFLNEGNRSMSVNFGTLLDRREQETTVDERAPTGKDVGGMVAPEAQPVADSGAESASPLAQLPAVSGQGREHYAVGFGLTLRGRTDATFSSSFRTLNTRTTPGTGCEGCTGSECVHVAGTLESTYRVATQVTLPRVSDYPNLTPCQRRRVQDAISNVLAPHEQQHVAAFNTYRGTTQTAFDMTVCRSDFDARIQAMHNSAESARQSAAQAASDALDPFEFEVDLNCQDTSTSSAPGASSPTP